MRFLGTLFLLLSLPTLANTMVIKTQIEKIDYPHSIGEPVLLFLKSGNVLKISNAKSDLLKEIQSFEEARATIEFSYDGKREILSAEETTPPILMSLPTAPQKSLQEAYMPSLLPDLTAAKKLFFDHRTPKSGETQCYNRAAVWTYEWRLSQKIYSNKIWIFFTQKYIRKYDFEWWFHVSPMVNVVVDGKIKERVMDMKYARGPLSIQQWTNIFMKDDAACPVVTKYSDHANFPESNTCFLQKSSMYFYQPIDLETMERFGNEKTGWVIPEVRAAYEEAFAVVTKSGDL
jgi:Glutaminase